MIQGTVSYDGRGQAGCEVRLCDQEAGRVVACTVTDEAGGFVVDADLPPRPLVVARCVDEAIGLAGSEPSGELPVRLDIASGGPLWPVAVEVDGAGDVPPGLQLVLEPTEVHHAPEVWLAAIRAPVDGVTRGGFTARPLPRARTVVTLQAGVWRLAAQRVVAVAAAAPGMTPEPSWVTDRAWVDGAEADVVEGTVTITVDRPCRVVLHVSAVS